MQIIYLGLSVLGLILPYSQLIPFFGDRGFDLAVFWSELFANQISTAFSLDVFVSSVVFWLFLWQEGTRLNLKLRWIYIVFNLTFGLSFALPLFLYMRSIKITQMQTLESNHELSGEAT
ncbi:MAG: DUF2834 domain-containing protein [Cyanobacteria bacterium P01_A01_bin.83]